MQFALSAPKLCAFVLALFLLAGCAPSLLERYEARKKAGEEFVAKLKKYSHLTIEEKNEAYGEELTLLENIKDIDLRSDIGNILGDAIAQNFCDWQIATYYKETSAQERRAIWGKCYKQYIEKMEAIDKEYETRLRRLYDSWPKSYSCTTQIFGNMAYTNCY